jgi:hypothetical protein
LHRSFPGAQPERMLKLDADLADADRYGRAG